MKAAVLVIVLLAAAGAVWYGLFRSEPEAPATTAQPAPEPATVGPPDTGPLPETATVTERRPAPPSEPKSDSPQIEYPDGSCYPSLNGVQVSLKPAFHPRLVPFTKIVGVERDSLGRDWYVHENGARSTVLVGPDGKARAEVEAPKPAQPLLPEEGGSGR